MSYVYDNLILFFNFKKHQDTPITHASTGSTSFDGTNDYIDCGDDTSLDITSAITISMWVKPDVVNDDVNLVGRDDGTNRNYFIYLDNGDALVYWVMYIGGAYKETVSTSSMVAGEWMHICATYDGSRQKLYINGVLEDDDAETGSIDNDDVSFTIGSREAGADRHFDGSICNVGIWSRALSSSEIQGLMYKKYADLSTAEQVSLVSWWGLDEDYTDSHGSNDGTNSGSTLTNSVYGDNAPSKPRIFDSAPDVVDNYGTLKSGTAVSFDGTNDKVVIGDVGNIKTVSFWVNADTATEQIIDLDGTQYITVSSNTLTLGGTWSSSIIYIDGVVSTTLSNDKWHHVAVTVTANIDADSVDFGIIGSDYGDITLSNVTMFDTTLTSSQVQELYNNPEMQLPTGVSASNLKGAWMLNEGVGTQNYDGSGNKNHGTMTGATWSKANTDIAQVGLVRQNTPMVFDGSNDTVNMGDVLDVGTSDFSVAFWINKTDTGNVQRVYSNYGAPGFTIRKDDSEKINIYMREGGGGNSSIITSTALDSNKFYHIVCTFDRSSDCKIYINASLDVTTSISVMDGDTMNNSADLVIGGGNSQEFDGIMNEVAQWDVVLDADAVTALYNSGTPLDASVDSGNYDNSGDLQGYWRNDGVTTWTDRSTNSNNGTVAGTPDSIVLTEGLTSGRDSQGFYLTNTDENCLTLNGAEYVEIPDSEALEFGDSNFSVEYWINTSQSTNCRTINKWNYSGTSTQWATSSFESLIKSNKAYARVGNGSSGVDVTSTTSTNDGNWHHIVFLRDGNTLRLYVDGSQEDTGDTSGFTIPNSTRPILIGKDVSSGNVFLDGMIDDIRIYSQTLSASEVLKNYNAGKSKHS